LAGFDFANTEFRGCDLRGADLSHTLGVTPGMFANATTDETTQKPRAWFWIGGRPPEWVEDWGRDDHGPWCSFRVPGTDVTQRMRWCPAGAFMMGSPDDDKFADDDEKPQHRVAFAQGFRMFETACSEALWSAVTGAPPRGERGPRFPVTDVSLHDARAFAYKLNAARPGLGLALPSEAQWEYACRAGTDTPYSFGRQIDKSQVRFGESFAAGPAEVGSLPANPWGFFEMHGNVYEWCQDTYQGSYVNAPSDGAPPRQPARSPDRVIRGGSWGLSARLVRAAFRSHVGPSGWSDSIGFRLGAVRTADDKSGGGVGTPAVQADGAQPGGPRPTRNFIATPPAFLTFS
jgi:formylglycine-generating enzyme required for sulfatase activity